MFKFFSQFHKLRWFFLISIITSICPVLAAPLEWSITESVKIAQPGDTVVFSGVISNQTGQALESTDLFLNFLAFDPFSLIPNQELGLVAFTLADQTGSGDVALFNVEIDPFALPSTYHLLVMLQDINDNLTDPLDISITILSTIPEPTTVNLLSVGLGALLLIYSSRFSKLNPSKAT